MSSFSHRPGPAAGGAPAKHFAVSAQCENSPSQQGALNDLARNGLQRPAAAAARVFALSKPTKLNRARASPRRSRFPSSELGGKAGVLSFRIAKEKGRKICSILGKGHFLIPDKLISSPTPEIKLETANGLLATGKAKAS